MSCAKSHGAWEVENKGMRKTFNDAGLEAEFQKEGFVTVPFLTSEEIEELKNYFFDTLGESKGHMGPEDENYQSKTEITYDFTFIDRNSEYKRAVFKKITAAFETRVSEYLADYTAIIANFIRKEEDGGEVPLHQNWAFADEHKCATVSIWCPLVDSSRTNGTLEVVPGSHKRYGEVRGPMIRSELEDIKHEIIENCMVPMEVKAGTAVVLDDSLVHYSSPNHTDGLRLAIQLILIPAEIPSIHYHMDLSKDRERVEVLEVDHDFYMDFNPWKKPAESIKRVKAFSYTPFSMSFEDFKAKLYATRFDEIRSTSSTSVLPDQTSWWSKLRSKLSKA